MAKGDVEDVGVYESDEGYVEKDVVEEGELDEVVKLSVELFFVCVFFFLLLPFVKTAGLVRSQLLPHLI